MVGRKAETFQESNYEYPGHGLFTVHARAHLTPFKAMFTNKLSVFPFFSQDKSVKLLKNDEILFASMDDERMAWFAVIY